MRTIVIEFMSDFWYFIRSLAKIQLRRETALKEYGEIDSKFRFVILVSKRAKQLLKGAKPKIKSRTKSLIRIAQEEVEKGLVDFELVKHKVESLHAVEDEIFIGEELIEEKEPEADQVESKEVAADKEKTQPKQKTKSKKSKK
jgi:DNA-directed RNA polymerase subunit K/omega